MDKELEVALISMTCHSFASQFVENLKNDNSFYRSIIDRFIITKEDESAEMTNDVIKFDLICGCIKWNDTPQGYDYWDTVTNDFY